jgi:deoxyribodipyrimidine photo-lyase
MAASLVWFRLDLRLADNPALHAAVSRREPIVPVYIWSPGEEGDWPPGAASRWWLHHSLIALDASLRRKGSRLFVANGKSDDTLARLCRETGADAVYFSDRPEPALAARDRKVVARLEKLGVAVHRFNSTFLYLPRDVAKLSGEPYQVFTPFWKKCLSLPEPELPLSAPRALRSPAKWPKGESVDSLELLPRHDWAEGFSEHWTPGEKGARRRLERFLEKGLAGYSTGRNLPAEDGVSRLSPHLHFGEVSPREVWHAVEERRLPAGSTYRKELGWRDFAQHILSHFPSLPDRPLRPEFARFDWRRSEKDLTAWRKGRTGYPIVDAGMRELWQTGWMHNRVRMIVGSFLVKDLRMDWREGERWFWDTLVDADLANNAFNWQWVGGCGADPAPYFRVFNPKLQGEKFDPAGRYVRRYVSEVGTRDYPEPMVDHATARQEALAAFKALRRATPVLFAALVLSSPAPAYIAGVTPVPKGGYELTLKTDFARGGAGPETRPETEQTVRPGVNIYELSAGYTFGTYGAFQDVKLRLTGAYFTSADELLGGVEIYPRDEGWLAGAELSTNFVHEPDKLFGVFLRSQIPFGMNIQKFSNPKIDSFGLGLQTAFKFSDNFGEEALLFAGTGVTGDGFRQNASVTASLLGVWILPKSIAEYGAALRVGPFYDADVAQRNDLRYGTRGVRSFRLGVTTIASYSLTREVALEAGFTLKFTGAYFRSTKDFFFSLRTVL